MAGARERTVRTAKGGASLSGPEMAGRSCVTEEVRCVLEELPGAEFRKKFNGVSFFVGPKVFAFLSRDGVVLKLPAERVDAVMRERESRRLAMGKRVMREWVVVVLPPGGLRQEVELLREAMEFVAKGAAG